MKGGSLFMLRTILNFVFKYVIAERIDRLVVLVQELIKALEDDKIDEQEKILLRRKAYELLLDLDLIDHDPTKEEPKKTEDGK